MVSHNETRKIVFHLRPWEVNLYVALEEYLTKNSRLTLEFLYLTHNYRVEYLLKKKGISCLNTAREWKKISFPDNWAEQLQELEDRFRGFCRNFQQYLACERFLKNKPPQQQILQLYRTVMFYHSYFKEHKPFFMLSGGPDHMAFWFAMDLLRYYGGHPCGLVSTSWPPNQMMLYQQVGHNYWANELYQQLLERGLTEKEGQEVRNWQDSLRQGKAAPIFINPYMRDELIPKRTFMQKVLSRLNYTYWQLAERYMGSWYLHPLFATPYHTREAWVRFRARMVNRYLVDRLDKGRPFIFFPLHLEPEATVLIHSNFYDNQLEIIRMLSKALPVSWLLAVKDHPNMAGQRSIKFIREVKQLPNVRLIGSDEPSWILIQQARLILVLMSTAGLEACLLGKPVLTFGNPAWNYAPTCRKVGDITKLPESILEAAAAGLSPEDPRVQAFLLSWVRANPPGICDYVPFLPPADHPENVDRIGQALIRLFNDLDNGVFSKK